MRHRLALIAVAGLVAVTVAGCATTSEQVRNGIRILSATGDQPGDEALITGTVALTEGGCVGLSTADETTHLVIWPHGTTLTRTDPFEIRLPSGALLRDEDAVEGSGGYYTSPDEFMHQIDTCKADDEVIRIRFD